MGKVLLVLSGALMLFAPLLKDIVSDQIERYRANRARRLKDDK
jgi:hypothetical protein